MSLSPIHEADQSLFLDTALDGLDGCDFATLRDWWANFAFKARGKDRLRRKVREHFSSLPQKHYSSDDGFHIAIFNDEFLIASGVDSVSVVKLSALPGGGYGAFISIEAPSGLPLDVVPWDINAAVNNTQAPASVAPFKTEVVGGLIRGLGLIANSVEGAYYNEIDLNEIGEEPRGPLCAVKQLDLETGRIQWFAVSVWGDGGPWRVPGLLAQRDGNVVTDAANLNLKLGWGDLHVRRGAVGEERELGEMDQAEFDEFCRLHLRPGEDLNEGAEMIRITKGLPWPERLALLLADGKARADHHMLDDLGHSRPFSQELLEDVRSGIAVLIEQCEIEGHHTSGTSTLSGVVKTHTEYTLVEASSELDLAAIDADLFSLTDFHLPEEPAGPMALELELEPTPEPTPESRELTEDEVLDWIQQKCKPAPTASVHDMVSGEKVDLGKAMGLLAAERESLKCLKVDLEACFKVAAADKVGFDTDLENVNDELGAVKDELYEVSQDLAEALKESERMQAEVRSLTRPPGDGALPGGLSGDITRLGKGVTERLVVGLQMWTEVADAQTTAEEYVAVSTRGYADIESMADAKAWITALARRL